MRMILLIDMDYFFAACEELKDPGLKEKPVAVTTESQREGSRGVVMTCNYPARKFGIHSGMGANQALRLCEELVLLKEDFKFYEQKSAEIFSIIKKYSTLMEPMSIDEVFVDISDRVAGYEEGLAYAKTIKDDINNTARLPCSIGVGPNKLISKMACDATKPDGIMLVRQENARAFLSELPVGKLYGIGSKTADRLGVMNIRTVKELAASNKMQLMEKFGTFGLEMHNYANGIDESEVVSEYETKSVGREKTLKRDSSSEEDALPVLKELSKEVFEEARTQGYTFKVITLKIRYSDFRDNLKSRTVKPSNSGEEIEKTVIDLYSKYRDKGLKIRKLGVRISGLIKSKSQRSMSEFFG